LENNSFQKLKKTALEQNFPKSLRKNLEKVWEQI